MLNNKPELGDLISNFNDMISKSETLTDKNKILRVNQLMVGEYFSGVVYVLKTTTRRNRDGEKYDLTFHCVDGDGVRFLAKMFGTEKFEIEKEIVLIKKGQTVASNYANNAVFYNIFNVVLYNNIQIPITEFIKKIDNITKMEELFNKYVEEIKDPLIKELMVNINEKWNLREIFKITQYSQIVGSSLGSPMEIYVNMMSIYNVLNKLSDNKDNLRYDLFNISTLLYVLSKSLMSNSDFISSDLKDSLDISLINNPVIKPIINSKLNDIDKSVILSIVQEGMTGYKQDRLYKGTNTLCIEFFRTLSLVESKLLMKEMCNGVEEKRLYDGTYII